MKISRVLPMVITQKPNIRYRLYFVLLFCMCLLTVWLIWSNVSIQVNLYRVSSTEIPNSFDGYRIVRVSDLHNRHFGDDSTELIKVIRDAKLDLIAITGDVLDSYHTDISVVETLIEHNIITIAPCYYVTGNQESRRIMQKGLMNSY